jgi:trk system potassium uptake protein TrkA
VSQQFAVIGLGRFGAALAETLDRLGHEVVAMEIEDRIVQELSASMPNVHLVCADAGEVQVLKDLGIDQFDAAAVVIGENIQASIMATIALKDLGVPMVISRAGGETHARVLYRIGADRVIQPEREMGEQLARTMSSPAIMDYVDLGEDEALVEARVPKKWVGKSLSDLRLTQTSGLTVVALKPENGGGTLPRGDTVFNEGDVMVIGGPKEKLDRLDILRS